MKKIILALLLLLAGAKSISPATPDWLDTWYRGYNVALFGGELPNYVAIDHDLKDDRFMAITFYENGAYQIQFNSKYEPSPKQAKMTLLHEMCHIQLGVEHEEELDNHGQKWQSCMHRVANQNGFESLW